MTIKQRIKRTYLDRLKRVWGSDLNAWLKLQATNVWAVSVFRYFFFLKWSRTELKLLDNRTRAVIHRNGCHQYGASVERLYLPRQEGGRGLLSLVHVRERVLVSMATYLMRSDDRLLKAVVRHQLLLEARHKHSLLKEARRIIDSLPGLSMNNTGVQYDGERAQPCKVVSILKAAQYGALRKKLSQKRIHGVFYKQCLQKGWDGPGSHQWLVHGRFRGQTEAMIVAAQDGVIHTRAYRKRVLKESDCASESCRLCGSAPETLGHIFSSCPQHAWSLYKERHDRILYQVILALASAYRVPVPEDMRKQRIPGTGVLEGGGVKMVVDRPTPTDRQLRECRPDLVAYFASHRGITIFEIACSWDRLVVEREKEKGCKYAEFAADLATQPPGWTVRVVTIVVGALGSLGSIRKQLASTKIFTERQVTRLVSECQHEALSSAVLLLRRHLALE